MRLAFIAMAFALSVPATASSAPSTSPGYTAADQAQFAKLAAGNGTWTCHETPPSVGPEIVVQKQVGNWFVSTQTGGAAPGITYVRWNHTNQEFEQVIVQETGAVSVWVTKASDPENATWTITYPAKTKSDFPFTWTMKGSTIITTAYYIDDAGKKRLAKSVCTKK